jgi:hypothetical protein
MVYIEIINELNAELFEKFGEIGCDFTYETNSYVNFIKFNDSIIWCSSWDSREFIEEINDFEPLLPHIKKLFNEYVDKLVSMKFDKND